MMGTLDENKLKQQFRDAGHKVDDDVEEFANVHFFKKWQEVASVAWPCGRSSTRCNFNPVLFIGGDYHG